VSFISHKPSLVSVIIPTYNYGAYVSVAIESVLAQTYTHVEIIVVDDGSTDNTKEITSTYGERISYFKQKNQGVSVARNFGFSQAKGDYILFLDADDWLKPNAVQQRVHMLDRQKDYGWVYGPCSYDDIAGKDVTSNFDRYDFAYRKKRKGNLLAYLLMGELVHPSTIMLRRAVLEDVGLFKEHLKNLEDFDLWVRVAQKYTAGFVASNDVVCVAHQDSASNVNTGGYGILLDILQTAVAERPDVVRSIGKVWGARLAEVMAGHADQLLQDNKKEEARKQVTQAIKHNPLVLSYYILWFRGWF